MLCDICHKKEATLFYTMIVNDKKTELHMCEECAIKKGLIMPHSRGMMGLAGIGSILPAILKEEPEESAVDLRCQVCGLTYAGFRKYGRLGCPNCYSTFGDKIKPLLKKIHGSTQHTGKVAPKNEERMLKKRKVWELKEKLREAVSKESYEEAAKIRDKLKKLGA